MNRTTQGDTLRLIQKLTKNGARKRLTVKQIAWLQDVAAREQSCGFGSVFFEDRSVIAKDWVAGNASEQLAQVRIYPNGAGMLSVYQMEAAAEEPPSLSDNADDSMEFSETPRGYGARERWARSYDDLNGAPEGDGDR